MTAGTRCHLLGFTYRHTQSSGYVYIEMNFHLKLSHISKMSDFTHISAHIQIFQDTKKHKTFLDSGFSDNTQPPHNFGKIAL